MATRRQQPLAREAVLVWTLFLLVACEVFATYSRLPVRDLYHVSGSGPAAGLSRALVLLNFPTALVALPILALVAGRLWPVAAVAALLCCAIFWPGIVDQADLDAKWANAIPAAGVAVALALTVWRARVAGFAPAVRARGDGARVVSAVVLLVVALPWLAADLGLFFWGTDAWWSPLGQARLHPAVHHGHHHGMDGTLLVLAALLLSRALGTLPRRFRAVVAVYLGILVTYGLGNVLNDAWYEQLVKRGVTSTSLPAVLLPAPNLPWLLIVVVGVGVGFLFLRASEAPRARRDGIRWPAALVPAAAAVALVVVGALQHRQRTAGTPFATAGGGELVFPMAPTGPFQLYAVGADGRGLRRLTDEDASDVAPAWSRGGRLAFQTSRDDDADVFVGSDAATAERVTGGGREGEPAWSPAGKRLAVIRDGDLYVMRADGTGARKLAHDARWPTWAPGGSLIAYESDHGDRGRIAVVTPDGRNRLVLLASGDNRLPRWSPRGSSIAYECREGEHWHVCLLDPNGGRHRVLTPGTGDEFAPAWSPDGRTIAFLGDRDGNDQLYVMRADGRDVRRLTSGQADKDAPAWKPSG